MKRSIISYQQLDGAVYACGFVEAGAGADMQFAKYDANATEAKDPLIRMKDIVRHGGVVIALTKAELAELAHAAGNSVGDPDWIKSCRNRKALLSVANKIGFTVTVSGGRKTGYR